MMEYNLVQTAEMSVIGAILINEKCLAKVVDKITPDDFYNIELKNIYNSMINLSSEGKVVDFITVLNDITRKENKVMQNEIKKVLMLCAEITPSTSNIEYYADIVHKTAISRKIERYLVSTLDDLNAENITQKSECSTLKYFKLYLWNSKIKIKTNI